MKKSDYIPKDGRVRITGGKYRGRYIDAPGAGTHPMGERERLALFNMLGDEVKGAYILDAYAGGGTLGFEALSRGADDVIFIEKNPRACRVLFNNGDKLKVPDWAGPFCGDVEEFLPMMTDRFDIILMDPPYDKFHPKMVDKLRSVLQFGGKLVVSHPNEPVEIDGLTILKTSKYAKAHITIYVRDEDDRNDGMTDEELYWLLHEYD